jgi:hypothetical protein
MYWTVSGADLIISLCCAEASSQWEAIGNHRHNQTGSAPGAPAPEDDLGYLLDFRSFRVAMSGLASAASSSGLAWCRASAPRGRPGPGGQPEQAQASEPGPQLMTAATRTGQTGRRPASPAIMLLAVAPIPNTVQNRPSSAALPPSGPGYVQRQSHLRRPVEEEIDHDQGEQLGQRPAAGDDREPSCQVRQAGIRGPGGPGAAPGRGRQHRPGGRYQEAGQQRADDECGHRKARQQRVGGITGLRRQVVNDQRVLASDTLGVQQRGRGQQAA